MAIKQKKQKKKEERGKKGKAKEYVLEVSQTVSDIKTFIDKFKSDVKRKKKAYQSYAQYLRKKKNSA